jgi:Tfp pilus assembly protein PilX
MRHRLHDERGWALMTAILFMAIMLGTILSVAAFVDGQTKLGADSRKRETAFNMSEAALNGQIFALSQQWPGAGAGTNTTLQYGTCTQGSTGAKCPNASALSKLIASPDASGATWQTTVRDNGGSSPNFYSDSLTLGQPAYDANNDKQLWVRATSTTRAKTRTMVTLVRVEEQQEDLPHAAIIANRLNDSNNGNKTLVNMTNSTGANGFIGVRCTPVAGESASNVCLGQPRPATGDWPTSLVETQLSPYDGHIQPGYPTGNLMTPAARERLRQRAIEDGYFYSTCPAALPTTATVIWIDSGNCQFQGTDSSSAEMLVLNHATVEFLGNKDFTGVIYAINADNYSGNVVMLHGNGHVFGGILVEGNGVVDIGSSGNGGGIEGNLVFDDNAFKAVKSYGTAGMVQNTWREIKG